MAHIYSGILLSHKKEQIWISPSEEWSKSEGEKQTSYINAYIWNLEIWYWWTYVQGRNGDADTENRLVGTAGEGKGGTMERAALRHTHHHMQTDGQCGVTARCRELKPGAPWSPRGAEQRGRWASGSRGRGHTQYLWLIHADVWQKPTQYGRATILQFKINE